MAFLSLLHVPCTEAGENNSILSFLFFFFFEENEVKLSTFINEVRAATVGDDVAHES